MKLIVLIAIFLAVFCIIFPRTYSRRLNLNLTKLNSERLKGKYSFSKYYEVPQADYSMRLISGFELRMFQQRTPSLVENPIKLSLYTSNNRNDGKLIELDDQKSLIKSGFNATKATTIIVHGWQNNGHSPIVHVHLLPALLRHGNLNVLVVDWGSIAGSKDYTKVKDYVPKVAEIFTKYLQFLHNYGRMDYKHLTLIGHSLGAHLCGLAAKNLINEKIGKIVGLDPARPLYSFSEPEERLNVDDANYVEIIHTNGGQLGIKHPIGSRSFYMNWGSRQPGCGIDFFGICAHSRSYEYYAELLYRNYTFLSIQCDSLDNIKNGNCDGYQPYDSSKLRKYDNSGLFYVPTRSGPPYFEFLENKFETETNVI